MKIKISQCENLVVKNYNWAHPQHDNILFLYNGVFFTNFNRGYGYSKNIFKIHLTEDNLNYIKMIFDNDYVNLNIDSILYIWFDDHFLDLNKPINIGRFITNSVINSYLFCNPKCYNVESSEFKLKRQYIQKIYNNIILSNDKWFVHEN